MKARRLVLCLFLSLALIVTFIPTISFGMNDDEHVISIFEVNGEEANAAIFSPEGDGGYYAQLEHGEVHGLNHEEDDQGDLSFIAKEGKLFDLFIETEEGWVVSEVYGEYDDNYFNAFYDEDKDCWSFEMPANDVNIYIEFSEDEENTEPLWNVYAQKYSLELSKDVSEVTLKVLDNLDEFEGEDVPELTYQWYYDQYDDNGLLDFSEEIENVDAPECTVSKEGNYHCIVSDTANNTMNVEFLVTYSPDWEVWANDDDEDDIFYISKDVSSVELEVGNNITGCLEDPELQYKWYYNNEEIEDATNSPKYTATQAGDYYCKVTDKDNHSVKVEFDVMYKTEWTVWVEGGTGENNYFYISKSSPTATLKVGSDITKCSENPELQYQWYSNGEEIEDATNSPEYTATQEGDYSCTVTDKDNHSRSVSFEVQFKTDWTIWSDGDSDGEGDYAISKNKPTVTLKVGSDISKCVENPELQYQWYREQYDEEDGSFSSETIEGATSATYAATQEGYYGCKVTDKDGNFDFVQFSVYYQTEWSAEADQYTVELGRTDTGVDLKVVIDKSGCQEDPELNYQWYHVVYGENDDGFEAIEGATSATYTATQTGTYICRITDKDEHSVDVEFHVLNGFSTLTEELKESADEIFVDDEKPVDTEDADGLFVFVAPKTGTYVFYSKMDSFDKDADPVGRILDGDGKTEVARDDDGLGGGNFQIYFKAEEGKTYYLQAINYDETATFTVSLMESDIKSISFVPSNEPLIAERDCNESSGYMIYSFYRAGDKLTLHKDGTDEVYVCKKFHSYEEEEDYYQFVLETDSDIVLPGWIEFDMDESYDVAIAPGSTKQITTTVSYAECTSNEFKTTIKFVLNHGDLSKTEAVAATCVKAGNSAYWQCQRCKKYYKDSEGINEIAANNWVIPAAHKWKHVKQAAGLMKNGIQYDQCTVCGAKQNSSVIPGWSKSYVKAPKTVAGKKSFTVKWKKQSKANQKKFNGYQIRYSTKKSMAKAKMVKVKKTASSKTIKKLKKKTKYFVQVRTYTKKGGKLFYSKWSAKKTVKTK